MVSLRFIAIFLFCLISLSTCASVAKRNAMMKGDALLEKRDLVKLNNLVKRASDPDTTTISQVADNNGIVFAYG